jgi:hypothetical protein
MGVFKILFRIPKDQFFFILITAELQVKNGIRTAAGHPFPVKEKKILLPENGILLLVKGFYTEGIPYGKEFNTDEKEKKSGHQILMQSERF